MRLTDTDGRRLRPLPVILIVILLCVVLWTLLVRGVALALHW
jgi:hypothetical protein